MLCAIHMGQTLSESWHWRPLRITSSGVSRSFLMAECIGPDPSSQCISPNLHRSRENGSVSLPSKEMIGIWKAELSLWPGEF